ncbi:hypothetical protein [Actinocorallia longicatena]|uniref:Uncharacterized protein n=1 Tax=Actinocorallia longicatena TaxID=111803 RepID=A0ABP6PWU8_9ACTN
MSGVFLTMALAAVGCAVFWRLTRGIRTGLPGCPWNPRRSMRIAGVTVAVAAAAIAVPGELWLTLPVAFALFVFGFARIFFTLIDLVMFPTRKEHHQVVDPHPAPPVSLSAYRMAQFEATGANHRRSRTVSRV